MGMKKRPWRCSECKEPWQLELFPETPRRRRTTCSPECAHARKLRLQNERRIR